MAPLASTTKKRKRADADNEPPSPVGFTFVREGTNEAFTRVVDGG
jgi:hypothetical protein